MILADTNILLRMADVAHPDAPHARSAVLKLHRAGKTIHIVPQNLYEFWAAATRPAGPFPAANGLGLSANRADLWIGYVQRNFSLLPDKPELWQHWRKLVSVFGVVGRKSHDVRLVAAMQTYGLKELLTFNAPDFKRFATIQIIDPRAI